MEIRKQHAWDVDYAEAIRIRQSLREKADRTDAPGIENVSILAGTDIAYNKGDDRLFAAVVLLRLPDMNLRVTFPHIPGLLSFREGPVLPEAFKKLPCFRTR